MTEGEKKMNAIEIQGLKKSFRGLYALDGLNMTVTVGAIYGFIFRHVRKAAATFHDARGG